jgi:hypothetical protein
MGVLTDELPDVLWICINPRIRGLVLSKNEEVTGSLFARDGSRLMVGPLLENENWLPKNFIRMGAPKVPFVDHVYSSNDELDEWVRNWIRCKSLGAG